MDIAGGGVILSFAFLFLFLASCSQDQSDIPDIGTSFKSFDEAAPLMRQIGDHLLQDNRWVNKNTLESLQSRHISIQEAYAGFSKATDTPELPSQITIDGIVYDVKIELFNSMNGSAFLKKFGKRTTMEDYGITEDPDEFNPNETDEEISVEISKSDGTSETITLKNPDYEGEIDISDIGDEVPEGSEYMDPGTQFNLDVLAAIEYPVFILTLEEVNNMEKTSMGGTLGKVATNRNWLCIKSIQLFKKLDSGDEEFQFFRVPGGKRNPGYGNVSCNGDFVLTGGDPRPSPIVYDNTARTTIYRKASTNEKTYTPTLALFPISANSDDGVTFIESDYGGLKFYRPTNANNDFGSYYKRQQYYLWLPNGTYGWHNQGYGTWGPAPGGKHDNCYQGEVLGINQTSVTRALGNKEYFNLPLRKYNDGSLITYLKVRFVQESLIY